MQTHKNKSCELTLNMTRSELFNLREGIEIDLREYLFTLYRLYYFAKEHEKAEINIVSISVEYNLKHLKTKIKINYTVTQKAKGIIIFI